MAGTTKIQRRTSQTGMFRAFGNRGYLLLWMANCLLYSARWMQMTLFAWLILEMTDSPWLVALVGFFNTAPMFLLGLIGGMLADTMNRQNLLRLTQGINFLSSVLLMLSLSTGVVQVWHIYMTILVSGACWALDFPSRRALIYDLLGLEGVTNAIALDSVGMNASRMIGPGVAGVLITVVGAAGGYTLITLLCGIACVLLWSLRVSAAPRSAPAQPRSIWRNLREGFGYVREHPTIFATILITIIMNLLLFPYVQMVPIVARDVLHVDAALMGALQAAEGLGALIGAMAIAAASSIPYHGRVFVGGSLLALLALLLFSLSSWYIVSLPALLLLGLGTAGFGTMQSTLVMLSAREEMRGRALGVLSLAIGAGPFGSLLIGAIANTIHPVFAVRMHALLGIALLALITVALPAICDRTQTVRASRPGSVRA